MQEITMSLCKFNNKQNSVYVFQCSVVLYFYRRLTNLLSPLMLPPFPQKLK